MNAVKALKLPIPTHNLGVINRAVELYTRLPRAKALEQMKRSTSAELEVVTVSFDFPLPLFSAASLSNLLSTRSFRSPSSLPPKSTRWPSALRNEEVSTPISLAKPTDELQQRTLDTTESGGRNSSSSCSKGCPNSRRLAQPPSDLLLLLPSLHRRSKPTPSTTQLSTKGRNSSAMPVRPGRRSGGGRSLVRSGRDSGASRTVRPTSSTPTFLVRTRQGWLLLSLLQERRGRELLWELHLSVRR